MGGYNEVTLDRMGKIITKLISDMPTYDNSLVQSMSSIQEVLDSVNGRIGEMRGQVGIGIIRMVSYMLQLDN